MVVAIRKLPLLNYTVVVSLDCQIHSGWFATSASAGDRNFRQWGMATTVFCSALKMSSDPDGGYSVPLAVLATSKCAAHLLPLKITATVYWVSKNVSCCSFFFFK